MTLHVSQYDFEALRRHCEETYPSEACGILLGRNAGSEHRVSQVVPCTNSEPNPSHRYSIDSLELIRVQKQARERGLEIVGFYHSHPDHPAQPSQTDLEDAHWIGCSYVITSVQQGGATETQSFLLCGTTEEDKIFAKDDLIID